MIGALQDLLNSLGRIFHLDLEVDGRGACSILIPPALIVQIQLDASQEKLFLFAKLAEIPPGKFRENVLKEALKTNALPDPLAGYLAYLNASSHLVLCQAYPLAILNGERLASFFGSFLEMAQSWQKALESGNASPAPIQTEAGPQEKNPFGLKP